VTDASCLNKGHGFNFASSMSYSRSDSIRQLVYEGMRTLFGESVLYYRSFGISSTLSGRS
jgi:hypothetical protein